MSWIGAGIGALLGAQRGGLLGAIIGAVVGNWIENEVRRRIGASAKSRGQTASRAAQSALDARPDPYEVLGCSRNASEDEVKRAYHEKVKRLHPDALRAQGLPEEYIAKANEQMVRLNAAWDEINRSGFHY